MYDVMEGKHLVQKIHLLFIATIHFSYILLVYTFNQDKTYQISPYQTCSMIHVVSYFVR